MSQTENTFKNSLRNFQLSRNTGSPIALPTSNSAGRSGGGSAFQTFRDSASNTFSNISNSVQGYMPLGGNAEEEEDPWYQLSRVEVSSCQSASKNYVLIRLKNRESWLLLYV